MGGVRGTPPSKGSASRRREGGDPRPRVILVAGSVADAREYVEHVERVASAALASSAVDEVVFAAIPADLASLPSLLGGLHHGPEDCREGRLPWIELPWGDALIEEIAAIRDSLRLGEARAAQRLRLRVRVHPGAFSSLDDALATLVRLSEAGLSSVIDALESLKVADARRILELFLHDPRIVRPVDPFAWILNAMVRRRPLSLWDVLAPSGERRVIEVRGGEREARFAAALRSRLRSAEAERFFCALPSERPACLECRAFPLCQGYGAWVGACEVWGAVIGVLGAAARELGLAGQQLRR